MLQPSSCSNMWKHGDPEEDVMGQMTDVFVRVLEGGGGSMDGGSSHLFDELLQFCRAAVHVHVATAGGRRHGHHGAFAI